MVLAEVVVLREEAKVDVVGACVVEVEGVGREVIVVALGTKMRAALVREVVVGGEKGGEWLALGGRILRVKGLPRGGHLGEGVWVR